MNHDEDMHFSSFYLRASSKKYMQNEYNDFGYNTIIAIYENFNETYYIPYDECKTVAESLLSTIIENPHWLQSILDEIAIRSKELGDVFPKEIISNPFQGNSIDNLLDVYIKHNIAHNRLYDVARIPEALDRGFGTFEKFLKSYLHEKMGNRHTTKKEINKAFSTLTFPEEESYILMEVHELNQILHEIQISGQNNIFEGTSKRALLKLDPSFRTKIIKHRDKWSFWGYHGYGSRALLDINYYLNRIMSDSSEFSFNKTTQYSTTLMQAENKRMKLCRKLRIDSKHEQLFRLYSRIGIIKLYRRYYQLRNFYYLDQLLYEIALYLNLSEAQIRSLLPEELESLMRGESQITKSHISRIDNVVYVINGKTESVLGGESKCTLAKGLLSDNDLFKLPKDGLFYGTPISQGIVRGRCKKIIRKEDSESVDFQPGDILVSESTDMDLYEIIQKSSGVVTESGGVSCHAAIVCRELNKPALVGVKNALRFLKNNDLIIVNADEGYLKTEVPLKRKLIVNDSDVINIGKYKCGNKAYSLAKLIHASIKVPKFFVLKWKSISKFYDNNSTDAKGPYHNILSEEVENALEYLNGEMFVIRSSMTNEDTAQSSSAGLWPSETCIVRDDVVPILAKYIEQFKIDDSFDVSGGIIVQEMILGDLSGVCFTIDPAELSKNRILIELVPGGNELLTEGVITPLRYYVYRDTKEIVIDDKSEKWLVTINQSTLQNLINICMHIEAICGSPQDIEWTIKQDVISILQSRPITTFNSQAEKIEVTKKWTKQKVQSAITSIYSAYRIPPNLRLHLFRTASVGQLICDNWTGSPLDRETLTTTLLLHDIGNIVKADYDRYPDLFPEEMKSLFYWKEVQRWAKKLYGDNDFDASLAIAKELNVSNKVLDLMDRKLFIKNEKTSVSDSWELKIAAYSDQRVGPHGILKLEERFTEAKNRYKGVKYASVNHPQYEILVMHAFNIENQISAKVNFDLDDLNDELILKYMIGLRSFELPLSL